MFLHEPQRIDLESLYDNENRWSDVRATFSLHPYIQYTYSEQWCEVKVYVIILKKVHVIILIQGVLSKRVLESFTLCSNRFILSLYLYIAHSAYTLRRNVTIVPRLDDTL